MYLDNRFLFVYPKVHVLSQVILLINIRLQNPHYQMIKIIQITLFQCHLVLKSCFMKQLKCFQNFLKQLNKLRKIIYQFLENTIRIRNLIQEQDQKILKNQNVYKQIIENNIKELFNQQQPSPKHLILEQRIYFVKFLLFDKLRKN
ncbi:unnamed protein product [Paramecium sonneborni]|uniref:Uncharacterized protein n=1 Tax=Paramecium sonneborni TaxID=65129 RepID=A0A8S1KYN4_9CILI|nr:unnamed protein product [Paramecium sonneborni]